MLIVYAAVSTLALDHDRFPRRSKSWAKLLSISLPSSFRDHPGLAKYRNLQPSVTFY